MLKVIGIIAIALICVFLAILIGLLIRILIEFWKAGSVAARSAIVDNYGWKAYVRAEYYSDGDHDQSGSRATAHVGHAAASITKNGKTYLKPESAPTESGMF